jgi:hypothetical protein
MLLSEVLFGTEPVDEYSTPYTPSKEAEERLKRFLMSPPSKKTINITAVILSILTLINLAAMIWIIKNT